LQRTKSAADDANLRIRKHHADRCAARTGFHRFAKRNTRGIFPRNASFVGRLVQQRDEVTGITGLVGRSTQVLESRGELPLVPIS
jgi:hypothetical protein